MNALAAHTNPSVDHYVAELVIHLPDAVTQGTFRLLGLITARLSLFPTRLVVFREMMGTNNPPALP
jgi:hypothetical protein